VPSEHVVVGRVGKPHGLNGAFVVDDASDDPDRFAVGAELLVNGEVVRVVESKRAGNRPVVRLDRRLERGTALKIERALLSLPGENEYYVDDLLGATVVEEGGRVLGRVTAIDPYEANDVLELDSGLLLPMVEECIREVDVERSRIVIARGFADAG
jgi:16S rRNA processing protein RimM